MPLAAMRKSFELETGDKGHFPHLFSAKNHYAYEGSVPSKNYFMTNSLNDVAPNDFHLWYDSLTNQDYRWCFWPEILKYCIQDVEILAQTVSLFSNHMIQLTGFNPFIEAATLPGFVNLILRSRYIPANTIALLPFDSTPRFRQHSYESIQWLEYLSHATGQEIRHARNHPDGEIIINGEGQQTIPSRRIR